MNEYRDRMIYEAIAWRDMFTQVKSMTLKEAAAFRNKGREVGLYAFFEWKAPDDLETDHERVVSCRKAAVGARYAVNDFTELLLNREFKQPTAEWEEKYRRSLSAYEREWPKCERAFPAAVKAMKKAYEVSPVRP